MEIRWNYYQYQKKHGYPVYIRFQKDVLAPKFQLLVSELGFQELTEAESKKIALNRPGTRVLTVQEAGPKIQLQITGSDLLDKYGLEILSIQAGVPVYIYRRVGLLAVPQGKMLWDLLLSQDISHTDQLVGMRIILTRFIAMALAEEGVLCYWGTVKDGAVVVMKQGQSFGEAVVIDFNKRVAFYPAGDVKLGSSLKLIRKDKEPRAGNLMGREEIISFLTVSTCLLSFTGVTPAMKKTIYDLSACTTGSYGTVELSAVA